MQIAVALLLLLLAPQDETKTYKLEYRFDKGDKYTDSTKRAYKLEIIQGRSLSVFEMESNEVLVRTIEEAEDHRPTIENVWVKDFTTKTIKHPEQDQIGEKKSDAVGRVLVWRRVNKERWGLFGRRAEETTRFRPVVERLKNWRDARLPKEPVKVGGTWKIPIAEYLATVGQGVPKGAEGNIEFKLVSVDDHDVAKISIKGVWTYSENGARVVVTQDGEWLFDVKHGRDLKLSATGEIDMSGAAEGKGKLRMERVVEWSKKE